jgi:hypothetical protein
MTIPKCRRLLEFVGQNSKNTLKKVTGRYNVIPIVHELEARGHFHYTNMNDYHQAGRLDWATAKNTHIVNPRRRLPPSIKLTEWYTNGNGRLLLTRQRDLLITSVRRGRNAIVMRCILGPQQPIPPLHNRTLFVTFFPVISSYTSNVWSASKNNKSW